MSVQIPFPIPGSGYALNSKLRINLDYIVDQFNKFNTGAATWDTVDVGITNSVDGVIKLYHNDGTDYTQLTPGARQLNITNSTGSGFTLGLGTSWLDLTDNGTDTEYFQFGLGRAGLMMSLYNTTAAGTFTQMNHDLVLVENLMFGSSASNRVTIQKPASITSYTLTLPTTDGAPNQVLYSNGSGVLDWGDAATLANSASKALDNLAAVSINTSLIPNGAIDLGSAAAKWRYLYAQLLEIGSPTAGGAANIDLYSNTASRGYIALYTTDNAGDYCINITNASQAGNRTYTIPDAGANAEFVMTAGGSGTGQDVNLGNVVIQHNQTYLSASVSRDGFPNKIYLTNLGTGAGSDIYVDVRSTDGDPYNLYEIFSSPSTVVTAWSVGIDNSDGDSYKICNSETFGTSSALTIAPTTLAMSVAGDVILAAGKNIVLTDDTTNTVTLALPAAVTSYTLTLPTTDGDADQVLKTDGSGTLSWVAQASAGANTALSNLASVAINLSLVSDTNNTDDLGSSTVGWKDLFLIGALKTGSNTVLTLESDGDAYFNHSIGIGGAPSYSAGETQCKVYSATAAQRAFVQVCNDANKVWEFNACGSTKSGSLFGATRANKMELISSASVLMGPITNDSFILGTNNVAVINMSAAGEVTQPLQPSFLMANAGSANVTGDGTNYTIAWTTEVYDQGGDFASNTFTAPVAGRYQLNCSVTVDGVTSSHTGAGYMTITTSNRTYVFGYRDNTYSAFGDSGKATWNGSVIADMDAGDTAVATVSVAGSTAVVDMVSTLTYNSFSGSLIN